MPGNWHVLFGKGPTEKDSSQEYLAGGLLHSGRGRRKRTPARSTSPAAYFTREGADGKGLQPGVPRRRPTSLGKGPTEKDSSQEYLAGGLLHSEGGRRKRLAFAGPRRRPTHP